MQRICVFGASAISTDHLAAACAFRGILFGFERTLAISQQPTHAIAEAAKQFGQRDDINVLSVTRSPVVKMAIA